jgi:type IV pilus assembly protein PilN
MRVKLNVATRPLESHRRFFAGASLALFLAAAAFVALGWHVYSVRKVDAELRARTEKIHQEMDRLSEQRKELEAFFRQKEIAELHDRASFINGIIDARSFNWTQMFMDLEQILPGGVRVISIEPQQAQGSVKVKLKVGASSEEAKLKFLHAIEESKAFREIELQSDRAPAQAGAESGDQRVLELTAVYSRI